MQHDVKGFGTIRPLEKDKDWGKKVFQSKSTGGLGYADYVALNSFTDEGLDAIADYNNYKDEWETEKKLLNKNAHIYQKRFINFKLYSQFRERRCYHLDPMEGGHRKVGNIQASFCSEYDFNRGSITNPACLTIDHFTNAGLRLKDTIVKKDQILNAYLKMVDKASENDFFYKSDTVEVKYLKSWDIKVKDFLSACRKASDMHSQQKRHSATKDPFVEIGHHASMYVMSTSPHALENRPDLSHIAYEGENKFPAMKLKKDLSESLNWNDDVEVVREALPLTDLLYEDSFVEYCKQPFSEIKKDCLLERLNSPTLVKDGKRHKPDDTVMMKPPFIVSWEAMAVDAGLGRNQRATVEMVNKWLLLPKFMHILMAHKHSKSLVETGQDEEIHKLVLYAARHHVHNCSASNLSSHPCMNMIYNFQDTPLTCLATSSHAVIHASLYLTEIVNAALTDKSLTDPEEPTPSKLNKLANVAKDIASKFSTLNQDAHYPGLDKIIDGLGKHFP